MPRSWSAKDERQYEHIKQSSRERGASEDRAQEIAARTVNKQRREEGRTSSRRTQGTGNPNRPLRDRSKDDLYKLARRSGIRGRSGISKGQLVAALQRR